MEFIYSCNTTRLHCTCSLFGLLQPASLAPMQMAACDLMMKRVAAMLSGRGTACAWTPQDTELWHVNTVYCIYRTGSQTIWGYKEYNDQYCVCVCSCMCQQLYMCTMWIAIDTLHTVLVCTCGTKGRDRTIHSCRGTVYSSMCRYTGYTYVSGGWLLCRQVQLN